MSDEDIVHAMELYGGSFVQALAHAYRCADYVNQTRLKTAFPDLWELYELLATARQTLRGPAAD